MAASECVFIYFCLRRCRLTLLQVHPISAYSLQLGLLEGSGMLIDSGDEKSTGSSSREAPLHSLFPLFRPAGDSHPRAVVPLEVDLVVARALHPLSLSRRARAKARGRIKLEVLSLFECVGVVLGFAIRHCCPLALGEHA